MDPIVFESIKPIRIPIKLEGKWYALCEATEEVANTFTNAGMAGIELDLSNIDTTNVNTIKESMKKGIKNFDPSKIKGTKAVLVQGCLKDCVYNEADNKITSIGDNASMDMVKNLPRKVLDQLFTKAKEISELDKDLANPFPSSGQKGTSES